MKSTFYLTAIFIILVFSSCTRYQYIYMNSHLPQSNYKEFVVENDTCLVKYSFAGQNCPVAIHVFNKLPVPLYVNWRKSAIIQNNEKIALWEDRSSIAGNVSTVGVNLTEDISISDGAISGVIYRDEPVSFLPPKSYINNTPIFLKSNFVELLPGDSAIHTSFNTANGLTKLKRYSFNEFNSPLVFRCFLAYSTREDFSSESYLDHTFWISDVIPTVTTLNINQGNNFYLKRETNFGTCLGASVLAGALTLALIYGEEEE